MDDFSIGNPQDEINISLEDSVKNESAALRNTNNLDSSESEASLAIRNAIDALKRYELVSVKDSDLLDQKVKNFVISGGQNADVSENSSGMLNCAKKTLYDLLKKTGIIDMYETEAKRVLSSKLAETEKFREEIMVPLRDKLYSRTGEKGLVVQIEEESRLREKAANAIDLAQKTRIRYIEEISGAKEDLDSIYGKMKDKSGDYTAEITFLRKHISETEHKKKAIESDIQCLEERFVDLDCAIENKEATVLNAELVYKSGMQAYRIKSSNLKRAIKLIQKNDISARGLSRIAVNINNMLKEGESIGEVEESFGEAFCETNRRIQERLSGSSHASSIPKYISDLRHGKIESEYQISEDIQSRVDKYKTTS